VGDGGAGCEQGGGGGGGAHLVRKQGVVDDADTPHVGSGRPEGRRPGLRHLGRRVPLRAAEAVVARRAVAAALEQAAVPEVAQLDAWRARGCVADVAHKHVLELHVAMKDARTRVHIVERGRELLHDRGRRALRERPVPL